MREWVNWSQSTNHHSKQNILQLAKKQGEPATFVDLFNGCDIS